MIYRENDNQLVKAGYRFSDEQVISLFIFFLLDDTPSENPL